MLLTLDVHLVQVFKSFRYSLGRTEMPLLFLLYSLKLLFICLVYLVTTFDVGLVLLLLLESFNQVFVSFGHHQELYVQIL